MLRHLPVVLHAYRFFLLRFAQQSEHWHVRPNVDCAIMRIELMQGLCRHGDLSTWGTVECKDHMRTPK
jgi:hypothetical protein